MFCILTPSDAEIKHATRFVAKAKDNLDLPDMELDTEDPLKLDDEQKAVWVMLASSALSCIHASLHSCLQHYPVYPFDV